MMQFHDTDICKYTLSHTLLLDINTLLTVETHTLKKTLQTILKSTQNCYRTQAMKRALHRILKSMQNCPNRQTLKKALHTIPKSARSCYKRQKNSRRHFQTNLK